MKNSELKFIRKHLHYLWKFMNQTGFEPDAKDSIDETALMYVAEDGGKVTYGRVATMLIRNGWDINAQDIYGKTPLHYALSTYQFQFAYDLLQYEMTEENMVHGLYRALCYYSRRRANMCDLFIQTLIEKMGGVSLDKCPDALVYALRGNAIPYLVPLVATGFPHEQEKYDCYFLPDNTKAEHVLRQFMAQRDSFTFENKKDYPLYIENATMRARPELYRKTWPSLPKGIKKQFNKVDLTLHTLNYIISKIKKAHA